MYDIKTQNRFFSKVTKTDSCWLWNAHCNDWGYGYFFLNGKSIGAHRISWKLFNNKIIPENHEIHHNHSCPKNCVNPDHLTCLSRQEHKLEHPKTDKDNWHPKLTEASAKKRREQTHCKYNHEFNKNNTRIRANGTRECKTCAKIRVYKSRGIARIIG